MKAHLELKDGAKAQATIPVTWAGAVLFPGDVIDIPGEGLFEVYCVASGEQENGMGKNLWP